MGAEVELIERAPGGELGKAQAALEAALLDCGDFVGEQVVQELGVGGLVALGVLPKYRRHGVAEMLVLRIIEEAMIKRGFVGECSLILENNKMMNRFLEAIGAEKYKTYRIYRRSLASTS